MRVLLIEDEKDICSFLKKGLEAEGFAVDVCEDGDCGFRTLKKNEYDAVILDNMLPKKTGAEICGEIRKLGKTMPILMLSANSETETKVKLLNMGADDYLIKPFSFEELLARLHALLRRPKNIQQQILNFADLVLDCRNQQAKRDETSVYLSRKEFSLLEYLMRNSGNVLSRGMIMEHVWDMNADPFSNTIESHILSLRKKIDLPGKKKLIQTVPGRGYKMDLE